MMPISQLAERCWVLRPEPVLHDGDEHFSSATVARKRARESGHAGTPVWLLEPCWTVRCDGECDAEIDEHGECYTVHSATRAEAEQLAVDWGWIATRDGHVLCAEDAPDCSTADLAVTEQIPGQLTLGEAVTGA